ncbi:MAG TPA: ribonuclease E activity regulator RraA [Gemmatimonadales bacterium]|nr:ribonuclease E activity regulator RraA [Gemmatimonadales bacterium]HRX18899.1 ribonuclease E activity regulator RraA [Gemmatimonadales bacterium]
MSDARWATADLCDAHPNVVHPVLAVFHDFGGVRKFHGPIATLRVDEDYRPVLRELEREGRGRVLVVDGGGSLHRAILGERLLHTAARNGWAGVVVNGAVRDTAQTREVPIGLRALGVVPQRGESGEPDHVDQPLTFAGATFAPGEWLWADADGIVVGPAVDGA